MSQEPANTCPDLDEAVAAIERARGKAEELRHWGKENAGRIEDLEGEVADLEAKISQLQDDHDYYESETQRLTDELEKKEEA